MAASRTRTPSREPPRTTTTPETWDALIKAFPCILQGGEVATAPPVARSGYVPPFICGAFSPDGSMVALSGGGRIPSHPAIWVAKVPSFETVAWLTGHQGVHDLAWDGKTGLLASASNDFTVVAWDVPRREHLFLCGGNEEPIVKGAVAFGDGVLYVGESEPFEDLSSRLLCIDLATGEVVAVHELRDANDTRFGIIHLAVDPVTDAWAFVYDDVDAFDSPVLVQGNGLVVDGVRRVDPDPRALTLHEGAPRIAYAAEGTEYRGALTFAPDGTKIEAVDGEVRTPRWNAKLGTNENIGLVRSSAAGDLLVVATVDLVALVDGRTGRVLGKVTPPAWFG